MLFWSCRVWTGMGGSRQTQSSLTSSGMQLEADPSAFPRPLCLPSLCCPASPDGCSGFSSFLCWVFLVLAKYLGCSFGKQRCSKCHLFLCWHILAGGDQRGPLCSAPSSPLTLQPLEEFSTVGAGGSWSLSLQLVTAALEEPGDPTVPCPALSPCLGTAGTSTGAHTATAGWQCHVPAAARGIFPPHPCSGLWDECGEALERKLGAGAAPVSGTSRKQPRVTFVL